MTDHALEMLAFNLKLIGSKTRKRVLVSAGAADNKKRLAPAVKKFLAYHIDVFTTPGTHRAFSAQGIDSTEVHKISDGKTPNILSLLKAERFDLVVNILTGDEDYDADSDAKLIRRLCIEHQIPLITDVEVAIATIDQLIMDIEKGTYRYKIADDSEPWNLRLHFLSEVEQRGGFKNHHAHFDKAYLISRKNLEMGQADMQKKWDLYQHLKENYTHQDLVERIERGLVSMIKQGATYCRTMVDADATVGLLPIRAALEVKERYKDAIQFEIGVQPLQGVLAEDSFEVYLQACELADYCGGLPSRDRPRPEAHLDRIFEVAKRLGKPVDVHVDQENNPDENESELLALKTIEHGLQGQVFAVHSISLAAHPETHQDRVIEKMLEADIGVIICPSAALSMKCLDKPAPIHNSIAPFVKMKEAGLRTYLGVDNINDLFLPINDGDLWTECRMLMEACRYYDLKGVADWACQEPIKARVAA